MSTIHQPVNEQIRSPFVFVIMPNGDKIGKTATRQAIYMAQQEGLDLIQVAEGKNGDLPIAKMIDVGKLKYKQAKQAKSNSHHDMVKEIQFNINIASHDLETKNRKVLELLSKKYKVKYTLEVKGRQRSSMPDAVKYLNSILETFNDVAVWNNPTVSGGIISTTLAPKTVK